MASDPVTVADLSKPVGTGRRRPRLPVGRRLPWAATAWTGISVVFSVGCGLALWFGRSPQDLVTGAGDWVADLVNFSVAVYSTLNFQVLIAMLAIGLVLERIKPARPRERSNGAVNLPLGVLMLFFQSAIVPLPAYIGMIMGRAIGDDYKLNLDFNTGDSVLLALAAMLMGSVFVDFFFFWFHRLQHSNRILWQEHIVHHSDTALNVTSTQRAHFFEFLLTPIAVGVPMTILFDLPPTNYVIITLIPVAWVYFVHMNLPVGFGRLWWLVTSPQYHRIHHSIEREHRDKNFALFFPLLDVIFGTAHMPRVGEFPPTGIEGVTVSTLAGAFMFPFVRWYRMITGTLSRGMGSKLPLIKSLK